MHDKLTQSLAAKKRRRQRQPETTRERERAATKASDKNGKRNAISFLTKKKKKHRGREESHARGLLATKKI